ncbi:MAG TPA: glycosyltransferase [Chloroflexia bacterium]|nr:glycosyltransferase [Chloroflexia bacterium]
MTTTFNFETINALIQPLTLPPLEDPALVSVLVSNFNNAPFLAQAIESVLAQTYPHFELIICDDDSTDNSVDLIEKYCQKDRRIHLLKQEKQGQASAVEKAFTAAQGQIISLLDSDDYCAPDRLEKIIAAFKRDPMAGCCLHQMLPVSADNTPVSKPIPDVDELEQGWVAPRLLKHGLFGTALSTSALSFRKEVLDLVFPLPPKYIQKYANKASPVDMYMLGIARIISNVASIPEVLVNYRFHGSNDGLAIRPTVNSVVKILDHVQTVFGFVHNFVGNYYGPELAALARLEDYEWYMEHLLALYILERKPKAGIYGYSPAEIRAHLPDTRRRKVWKVVLALPPFLSEQALAAWWGMAPWKKFFRPIWRVLRT